MSTAPLIGLLLMRTAILFAGNAVVTLVTGGDYHRALMYANVGVVVADVITLTVVAALLRREGRTLRDLLAPRWRDTGWGLLAFVVVLVAFFVATFAGNLVAYLGPPPAGGLGVQPPVWLGVWTLVVLPVTVALAEEGLYRGYATDQLTPRIGRLGTLILVAVFFAAQHAALTPLDAQAQLARFVTTLLVGLTFGLLRLWLNRLWPLVIAHWLVNVLGLGLPMLAASLA